MGYKFHFSYIDRNYWFEPDQYQRMWYPWRDHMVDEMRTEEHSFDNWERSIKYKWDVEGRDGVTDVEPCELCGMKYGCHCKEIDSDYAKTMWL